MMQQQREECMTLPPRMCMAMRFMKCADLNNIAHATGTTLGTGFGC